MERVGGHAPFLKTAIGKLSTAIGSGVLVAEACQEATQALQMYLNDLNKLCESDDPISGAGDLAMCRRRLRLDNHQLQAVRWTPNWDNPNSAVRKAVQNAMLQFRPQNNLLMKRPQPLSR